jgi:hypothetical protein
MLIVFVQVGDGTTINRWLPTDIIGLGIGVVALPALGYVKPHGYLLHIMYSLDGMILLSSCFQESCSDQSLAVSFLRSSQRRKSKMLGIQRLWPSNALRIK